MFMLILWRAGTVNNFRNVHYLNNFVGSFVFKIEIISLYIPQLNLMVCELIWCLSSPEIVNRMCCTDLSVSLHSPYRVTSTNISLWVWKGLQQKKKAKTTATREGYYSVFHVIVLQEQGCCELVLGLIVSPKASMWPQDWAEFSFRSEILSNWLNNVAH